MQSEVEISQFISTKLCHDLAGAIGAVNNSVEFLNSANKNMVAKAHELLKMSAEQGVNRLVFYRNAYGVSKYSGEANLEELKLVATNYLKDTKISLDFHERYFGVKDVFISTDVGKLILCMIHHAVSNLVHGGDIIITVSKQPSSTRLSIAAVGDSLKIENIRDDILNNVNRKHKIDVKNCISYFAVKFSELRGVNINVDSAQSNKIEYILTF
ncbi:MAG: histidine phosphotransferase family protein [Rickettsiaceae bacterium]|nr:histidine phosphotransferase family protein [Rickettsiaceae bacterium]